MNQTFGLTRGRFWRGDFFSLFFVLLSASLGFVNVSQVSCNPCGQMGCRGLGERHVPVQEWLLHSSSPQDGQGPANNLMCSPAASNSQPRLYGIIRNGKGHRGTLQGLLWRGLLENLPCKRGENRFSLRISVREKHKSALIWCCWKHL